MKHFFVLSSFNPGAILQMLNSYPPDLTTEATTLFPVFPESLLCFQQQINLLSGAISTLRTLPHSFYSCSCFHGLLSSLVQVIFPPPNPTTCLSAADFILPRGMREYPAPCCPAHFQGLSTVQFCNLSGHQPQGGRTVELGKWHGVRNTMADITI